jgi:anti-anti-sigma factor
VATLVYVVFYLTQAVLVPIQRLKADEDCIELAGRVEMAIQDWSENIILVDLPPEPQMSDELEAVTEIVRDRADCEVVVDFSSVDIVTSSSLSKLLRLRKLMTDCGHQLVFCGAAPATKKIFTITGLDEIFEFVDDKFVALAGLQMTG